MCIRDRYKRPTFDVTFEPVKVEYQVGDSIEVVGMAKTFAGAPVQHARVHLSLIHICRIGAGFFSDQECDGLCQSERHSP